MIDANKMKQITDWLIENVFRNIDIMYNASIRGEDKYNDVDLVNIIASLHNLLYECVHGEPYDYMFHWANKIGSDCQENIFYNMEEKENE